MADRVARETIYAKSTDKMCREDSRARLSAEEKAAAEKCLSSYCKPVELYNILRRRALKKPLFLQRCLSYNKFDKQRNRVTSPYRVQMTISVSAVDEGQQPINLFPLCILLARSQLTKDSATYHFSRFRLLTAPTEVDMNLQAKFVLPELKKLSEELKRGSLDILFISCAELIRDHTDPSSFSCDVGGQCFLGRIPMELLHLSWENSSTFSWGERTSFISRADMHPCLLMAASSEEDKCVSFKFPNMAGDVTTFHQLQANITAEEIGAKWKTSHDVYNLIDVPLPLVSPIKSARTGTVVFKYKYYGNDMQETEATEDFSCPFCLVKCSSYKGLRLHLTASHDLFNFEFGVNADDQIVNVTVKTPRSPEAVGPDPKYEAVFYCSKPQRRRRTNSSVTNARHVHPIIVLDSPVSTNGFADKTEGATDCVEHDASSPNTTEIAPPTAQSYPDPDRVLSLSGSNIAAPQVLQFAADCVEYDTSSPNTTEIAPPTAQSYPDPDRVLSLPGSNIAAPQCVEHDTSSPNTTEIAPPTAQPCPDPDHVLSLPGRNITAPQVLQFARDCVEHDTSSPNTTELAPSTAQPCPDPDHVLSLPGRNITAPQVLQFARDCVEHDTSSPNTTEVAPPTAQSCPDPDRVLSLPGRNITAPQVLQFATDCVEHDTSSPTTTEVAPPTAQSCPDPDRVLSLPGRNITAPQVLQFATDCVEHDTSSPTTTEIAPPTAQSCPDPDRVLSLPGSNITDPQVLQFATDCVEHDTSSPNTTEIAPPTAQPCPAPDRAKSRKSSMERSDPRNRALLKRQFFHSHSAQPMTLEEVFSDQDSEDEVDDEVALLEDCRMLDDFVEVTKAEKKLMCLWNSFVRKQSVLPDCRVPWACEAFTKLHGKVLTDSPALIRCWRLFMLELWNHGLLDACALNNCNVILEQKEQDQDADPVQCETPKVHNNLV